MKKLKDLIDCEYDLNIFGVADDSRNVRDGYLFVATKGFNVDHYDYIEDAISNGACFVVADREINFDIPHMQVDNINDFFIECSRKFYDINLDDYNFIGITGTDGKTTTATILSQVLKDTAYIGTNGFSVSDKTFSTNNTTPCISELYNDLKVIKDNDCSSIVMEVSSEALLHDRVSNFKFDMVGFTNITGDHLNVHGSFENYLESKFKLLDLVKEDGYVVVNGDDSNLVKIKHKNKVTFGFDGGNDFVISNVNNGANYSEIIVRQRDNEWLIKSPLKGKHNVYNLVMAFVMGLLKGVEACVLIDRISKIDFISGRCELLDFGQDFSIVLDYAHTINGTGNILEAFKGCGKTIVVVGCAGGREKEKRSVIGKLVMDNSDIAIFTMDDPRHESVDKIISEMVGNREDYIKIIDREEAIRYAFSIARRGDTVLLLGKGRDNYMMIGEEKIPYSDYEVVEKFFK